MALSDILASNAKFSSTLPSAFVAVFAGATSGIGEVTLKTLVGYAPECRVYLLGRSVASIERVRAECRAINPRAIIVPVQTDLSSIRETAGACSVVQEAEDVIHLMVLSAAQISVNRSLTPEGLHKLLAAMYYSKMQMIRQLLPQLEAAATQSQSVPARVVVVAGGGCEGDIDVNDVPELKLPLSQIRGHMSSIMTLSLEQLAGMAPHVSFIHDYPGSIRTGLRAYADTLTTRVLAHFVTLYIWLGEWLRWPGFMTLQETGERHVFLATSDLYPPKAHMTGAADVAASDGVSIKRGSDGEVGSGMYTVGWDGESAPAAVEAVLRELRQKGADRAVWQHTTAELERIITGTRAD